MYSIIARATTLQAVLPTFADAALKGTVLVGCAAIAAYALRKRSAASRHAVWTAAVIGHLAIPVFTVVLPAWRIPLLPAAPWMSSSESEPNAAVVPNADATSQAVIDNSVTGALNSAPAADKPEKVAAPSGRSASASVGNNVSKPIGTLAMVAGIWAIGAVLVLLRLAFGTWQVGRLARVGARVEDGAWLSLTQRLANRLGVTRPLTLLRGDRLAVPVTWGIVYPAVLLPQDADAWPEERRRFVLVHEMAHVKRFDALTQLLAQITVALFWFDPLVWIAAHQMRVEREHACDDYVLRDGTTPSLYAGELLEMVRSIGTPRHDRAAPAFAALAMARRSEFEGRMLAILDPRQDRKTLNRRGTFMTAVIVALLTIPLAALRPFHQASTPSTSPDEFPSSFKVTFSDGKSPTITKATPSTAGAGSAMWPSTPMTNNKTAPTSTSLQPTQARYTCERYPVGTELRGTSSHISAHVDSDDARYDLLVSDSAHCTEASIIGKVVFSPDEKRIAQLSPDGFARFRERTSSFDRTVTVTPVGDGSLRYTALINGQAAPFDGSVQAWLEQLLPTILREIPINVPARVARLRAQGGVPAVLQEIARMRTGAAKRAHYEELLKGPLSEGDAERIAAQAPRDLASSSGDLSAVIQKLPRNAFQSAGPRKALAGALSSISSSGDKANTLEILAPNADAQLLIMLAKAAEDLPSSGDKANFLMATAAEYLSPGNEALRNAYFRATSTLQSSGDMANVLMTAMPYGHASPVIALQVIDVSKGLASSGDAANVLLSLVTQRVLTRDNSRGVLAAIDRTMTMGSSGDRANVLISIAEADLLSTRDLKDAFIKAAMALPSDGDRGNVLAAAARH